MPAPILSAVSSVLPHTFHQVAMFCPGGTYQAQAAVDFWSDQGYDKWIYDLSLLVGNYHPDYLEEKVNAAEDESTRLRVLRSLSGNIQTRAMMWFNYDIMAGMELEFLAYENVQGQHRWSDVSVLDDPFITHMSTYVDDVKLEARKMKRFFGFAPYHRFITTDNENPAVKGQKRFIECIFGVRDIIGYDVKLIQKVPWSYNDADWLGFDI